ncbi:MAG TPA: SRPBCC family protein [Candidatus Baltobacteraceae bacterium]|nr:SRPBCC family protein [Candidatus Baltobacteraceae bacterium]
MASIRKEVVVAVAASHAWEVIRDIGNAHKRLFPGVLVEVTLIDGGRMVTFANGLAVNEATIELNDDARRYAWTASGGRTTHHNASLQVFAKGDGECRIVWIVDLLPDEIAAAIEALVDAGATAMKTTLESATASASS